MNKLYPDPKTTKGKWKVWAIQIIDEMDKYADHKADPYSSHVKVEDFLLPICEKVMRAYQAGYTNGHLDCQLDRPKPTK